MSQQSTTRMCTTCACACVCACPFTNKICAPFHKCESHLCAQCLCHSSQPPECAPPLPEFVCVHQQNVHYFTSVNHHHNICVTAVNHQNVHHLCLFMCVCAPTEYVQHFTSVNHPVCTMFVSQQSTTRMCTTCACVCAPKRLVCINKISATLSKCATLKYEPTICAPPFKNAHTKICTIIFCTTKYTYHQRRQWPNSHD